MTLKTVIELIGITKCIKFIGDNNKQRTYIKKYHDPEPYCKD